MSELRKDPVSRRWVIFSPDRAHRPVDVKDKSDEHTQEDIKNCPFCEGKEKIAGAEILAYDKVLGRKPNTPGWWVRVLENKYPALESQENLEKKAEGIYDWMNDLGRHEIIVETPNHFIQLPDLTEEEIEKVLLSFKERYYNIKNNPNIEFILIFKNYGKEAGASLQHSHSQLIATPVVPNRVKEEVKNSKEYYSFRDRCIFCDIVTQELSSKKRIIEENEDFVSFVFYAGRFPYETWILPKEHASNFEDTSIEKIRSLAEILKKTLTKIQKALNDTPYNLVFHTLPVKMKDKEYFHWHIEIMPKTTRVAGFEWGSGFYINPILPEDAAKILNGVE